MKRALILAGLIVASITLILVIAPEQSTNTKSSQVAATIFPIYDITKNVVGNTMDVALIVPSGASPHTFEPAPSTLRDLAQTEVVFSIGHGLDDWTDNLVLSIGAQNITVDSNIDLLDASAENISDPQNSYNGLSNVDPHYWLS
ncbi:MAG: metal ABC transporter substrate-binding protein, partial [Candidatus Uhrbacteria bacterium]|nr:metal ABC transporter substrate-binding protein [Candidatus Uhrbacteria bacterium]